jgi:hypothetical protein
LLLWYETWPLTLWKEHRLRVFENKVLRILEFKGDEIIRGWRKLLNELRDLYCLPVIVRMNKPRGACKHGRGVI